MGKDWVDFAEVKQAVSMEMVLAQYGVELRRVNATSLRGTCPLPTHNAEGNQNSFAVSTAKNAWACHAGSCVQARDGKKGGNVLDFVAVMEGCTIRDAALKLQKWFNVAASNERPEDYTPSRDRKRGETPTSTKESGCDEEVNQPLTFTLENLDAKHWYFKQRGIREETVRLFGGGFFDRRGSMAGRIVFPVHDESNVLIGYAGRAVDDELAESDGKYKTPFKKSLVVFNLHRAKCFVGRGVVIAEGFFDCMKIYQAGFPNVVALMGSELYEHQEELLTKHFDRAVLLLDGDEAGRAAASAIASRLTLQCFVRVVGVGDGKQPDQLSSGEIQKLLASLGLGGGENE